MNNTIKGLAGACALLAMTATAAQASSCWNPVQAAAAKVRNLQSRLMDATLRCQMVGVDISATYNAFIRENRSALQGANTVLRDRLGEREFDHFVTELANAADHAATDVDACAAAADAAQSAVEARGSVQTLLALEAQFDSQAELPGGECQIDFAAAAAPASATAIVVVQAPLH
jgi:chemotaxis protein histidine kinase CheA